MDGRKSSPGRNIYPFVSVCLHVMKRTQGTTLGTKSVLRVKLGITSREDKRLVSHELFKVVKVEVSVLYLLRQHFVLDLDLLDPSTVSVAGRGPESQG